MNTSYYLIELIDTINIVEDYLCSIIQNITFGADFYESPEGTWEFKKKP